MVRAHGRSVQSRAIGEVGDLAAAAVEKPEKLAELEKLAAKGRTARLANLELARYWAERGDWAKAESFAGRIPDGRKDLLHYQAEDLKAQIALGQKDFDKAIAIYKKAVDEKPKVYPIDAAPLPARREPRAQGRDEGGPRPLQEAPGRVRPVLLRLRGLPQGRPAGTPEIMCYNIP